MKALCHRVLASRAHDEDCIGGPYPIGPGEWVSPLGFAPRSVWVY